MLKYLAIGLLKTYRLVISPLYGNVCRYYPSCSAYALRAVEVHGAVKGSWLAARRLARCHPWAAGGYDPVPGTPEFAEEMRDRALREATLETYTPDLPSRGELDERRGLHDGVAEPARDVATTRCSEHRSTRRAVLAHRRGVN